MKFLQRGTSDDRDSPSVAKLRARPPRGCASSVKRHPRGFRSVIFGRRPGSERVTSVTFSIDATRFPATRGHPGSRCCYSSPYRPRRARNLRNASFSINPPVERGSTVRDAMDNAVASEIEGREIRVFPLFFFPSSGLFPSFFFFRGLSLFLASDFFFFFSRISTDGDFRREGPSGERQPVHLFCAGAFYTRGTRV